MKTRRFLKLPKSIRAIPKAGSASGKGAWPQIYDGQAFRFNWRKTENMSACCECKLIHVRKYTVRGDWLIIQGYAAGHLRRKPTIRERTA